MESFLHYCIRVILNESMNILSIETIKCLSLVSREISTTIKPFIERDYCFVLYHDRRLTHYSPQNLKGVQNANQITPSTKKLKTYDFFIEPIDLSHFTHITHLEFGIHFNTPIDSLLPPNITHLTLGHYFNKPVDHLPQSITHLTFGPYFEQPLITLPPNTKLVQFKFNDYNNSLKYNHPVSHLNPNIRFQLVDIYTQETTPYQYKPNWLRDNK